EGNDARLHIRSHLLKPATSYSTECSHTNPFRRAIVCFAPRIHVLVPFYGLSRHDDLLRAARTSWGPALSSVRSFMHSQRANSALEHFSFSRVSRINWASIS